MADNLDPTHSTTSDSPSKAPIPFSMSGDGVKDITIPAVFMKKPDATKLRHLLEFEESVYVLLTWIPQEKEVEEGGEEDKGEEESASEGEKDDRPGAIVDSMYTESGLYDSGLERLEPDHEESKNEHTQTCSTEACNSPDGSP